VNRYIVAAIATVAGLFGVGGAGAQQFNAAPIPSLQALADPKGFVDLDFGVHSISEKGGTRTALVKARFEGELVEFLVELSAKWDPRKMGPMLVHSGTVAFVSSGAGSDRLIQSLTRLYGVNGSFHAMPRRVEFDAISLQGNPRNVLREPVKIKLFYQTGVDAEYAEAYANFDMRKLRFEFHEKDPEYRAALVNALAGKR
jgi:hypothetical protein